MVRGLPLHQDRKVKTSLHTHHPPSRSQMERAVIGQEPRAGSQLLDEKRMARGLGPQLSASQAERLVFGKEQHPAAEVGLLQRV